MMNPVPVVQEEDIFAENGSEQNPTFNAVADEESQVITVQATIDFAEDISTNTSAYEVTTKPIDQLIKAILADYPGYHINEDHTVIECVELENYYTDFRPPLVVISNEKTLNNTVLLNCMAQNDGTRAENNNNNNNNNNTSSSSPLQKRSGDSSSSSRTPTNAIRGCFSMIGGVEGGYKKIMTHKITPKKDAVLRNYGDVTENQMREDLLNPGQGVGGYVMIKHFSVLEHAIRVNVKKRILQPFNNPNGGPNGGYMFRTRHMLKIIQVVEQHKRDNVQYVDLKSLIFKIRRRDGRSFDDKKKTFLENTTRSMSDFGQVFPVYFVLKFTIKMFKNRPTMEDHLSIEDTEEESYEDEYMPTESRGRTSSLQVTTKSQMYAGSNRMRMGAGMMN